MQTLNFEEVIDQLVQRDPRYHRAAYFFLREALDHTQKMAGKNQREAIRHVTGQELLEGIRQYALAQYGPMALALFHDWGIRRCEDFGEIVFNMVESKLLSKTDQDRRNDFKGAYDFCETFRQPFLPSSKQSPSLPESNSTKF